MRTPLAWVAIAAACFFAGTASAQIAATPATIVVVGSGVASQDPDSATLSAHLRGEGKTAVEALKALADTRARVEQKLRRLGGAQSVEVTADRLSVKAARSGQCGDEDYSREPRLSEGGCVVSGYVATLSIGAEVRPADRIGDAASLAAELGATDVSVEDSDVDAPDALKNAATKDAMADALKQATQIAAAAGVKLGPVLRVQDEQARYADDNAQVLVVTAARAADAAADATPSVSMQVKPPPVTSQARLIVTYSVLP